MLNTECLICSTLGSGFCFNSEMHHAAVLSQPWCGEHGLNFNNVIICYLDKHGTVGVYPNIGVKEIFQLEILSEQNQELWQGVEKCDCRPLEHRNARWGRGVGVLSICYR